jgi:predicted RNA-binding protein with EMAP domain
MHMQPLYTNVKIYNEIELCEVSGLECKNAIEKALLQKRISYFVRWLKPSLFKKKNLCIICVNDNVREEAEEVVRALCDETGYEVRFLMKKSQNHFL